tara:strand:+ start:3549 stop:3662 length:114 start_codon:yes stop_codon:yes gene_type:complete
MKKQFDGQSSRTMMIKQYLLYFMIRVEYAVKEMANKT